MGDQAEGVGMFEGAGSGSLCMQEASRSEGARACVTYRAPATSVRQRALSSFPPTSTALQSYSLTVLLYSLAQASSTCPAPNAQAALQLRQRPSRARKYWV